MSKTGRKNISNNKEKRQEPVTSEVENTGNYLRTLRMGKGLSIKDVTEATRISETNLNAIEDENFSALPANTFTRGLLNIYADFLGANKEAVVTKFMEDRGDSSSQKRRSRQKQSGKILSPRRLAEPSQISSMTMAGVLFLVIVISFTGYCVYTSWNPFSFLMKENRNIQSMMKNVFSGEKTAQNSPAQENTIPVPVENQLVEAMSPTQEITEESPILPPEATADPEEPVDEQNSEILAPKYTLTIRFLKDTSIELAKDDDEIFTEEFESGDVQSWSAESSLTVTFSQPDSAEILVNDSPVDFPESQDGIYTMQIPHDTTNQQDE
jgi:cytoskeleton protein RodZ